MQVKGIGIKTTRDFVKENFAHKYDLWLQSLPNESRKIYENNIGLADWYDAKYAYYIPFEKLLGFFYKNNFNEGADVVGRFSAEKALRGIYRVFLIAATPQYLMKKAVSMMNAYYKPANIDVNSYSRNQVTFYIHEFDGISEAMEYRMAGWCSRALELCGCDEVSYQFETQLSRKEANTVINFRWV